jgi:hypothetical protein
MYLLYGLLALGVAVGVVALLIIFSLLALARKGEAHLDWLEGLSRESPGPPRRPLIPMKRRTPAIWPWPLGRLQPRKASRPQP